MEHIVSERESIAVAHPEHGETVVEAAMNKVDALMEAARRWRTPWTELVDRVTFRVVDQGEALGRE